MEITDKNYKYVELNNLLYAIRDLRTESPDSNMVNNVKVCLNSLLLKIFNISSVCNNVYFTKNVDNIMFGLVVQPVLENPTISILFGDDNVVIKNYNVELDSKLFDTELTDEEIAALLLYNVLHLLKDNVVEQVRNIAAEYLTTHDEVVSGSVKDAKLKVLDFGIIDAMIQLTSSLQITREDQITDDPYLSIIDLGVVLPLAISKAYRTIPGCDSVVERQPRLNALDWCFRAYFDFKNERILAIHTLKKVSDTTASYIYKTMISNLIIVFNTVNTDNYYMESEMLNESLFANLKYNGLRGLENDLYEFMVRARNADTEDEVMYALKQINTRLSILDDYLSTTDPEKDRNYDRWEAVYTKYKAIRDEIAAKKVYNKRNYGIFIDYDKLDREDNANGEDYSM